MGVKRSGVQGLEVQVFQSSQVHELRLRSKSYVIPTQEELLMC